MSANVRLRVFVASGAALLTDRSGHGEGLIAHALFSALAARGHDVVVCARFAELGARPPYGVVELGRATRFESLEPLAYARAAATAFTDAGGPAAFDVVHWLFPQEDDELVFRPPGAIPYVVGPTLPPWPKDTDKRTPRAGDAVRAAIRPALRRAHRRALERADAILAANPPAADALPEPLRAAAVVVPFGVDATRFSSAPPPADARLLFLGRLERAKGVRELVEAFALARRRVPAARLDLVGEGPERGWIAARSAELGLDGSLTLRGPIAHERVPEALASAGLVCLPSHGEPYGMAVLESMAAGRAVVTTNAAGPKYLVVDGEGGRLVEPHDVEGLADALASLLGDRAALQRMGAFNRERVERDFTLTRVAERIEDVYVAAIDAGRAAA